MYKRQTLYEEPNAEAEVVGEAETGETYQILELVDEEWMKIDAGEVEGYRNTVKAAATVMETAEEVTVDPSVQMREEIVNYALQFVGNPYVYGGTNPNTGADCSGFTSYILRNVAGVELDVYKRQFHAPLAAAGNTKTACRFLYQGGKAVYGCNRASGLHDRTGGSHPGGGQ